MVGGGANLRFPPNPPSFGAPRYIWALGLSVSGANAFARHSARNDSARTRPRVCGGALNGFASWHRRPQILPKHRRSVYLILSFRRHIISPAGRRSRSGTARPIWYDTNPAIWARLCPPIAAWEGRRGYFLCGFDTFSRESPRRRFYSRLSWPFPGECAEFAIGR